MSMFTKSVMVSMTVIKACFFFFLLMSRLINIYEKVESSNILVETSRNRYKGKRLQSFKMHLKTTIEKEKLKQTY